MSENKLEEAHAVPGVPDSANSTVVLEDPAEINKQLPSIILSYKYVSITLLGTWNTT